MLHCRCLNADYIGRGREEAARAVLTQLGARIAALNISVDQAISAGAQLIVHADSIQRSTMKLLHFEMLVNCVTADMFIPSTCAPSRPCGQELPVIAFRGHDEATGHRS